MPHHLNEQHIRERCHHCKKEFSEDVRWRSEFDFSEHYKVVTCNCGKETWLRVSFHGSGHDDWDGQHSWVFTERKEEFDRVNVVSDKIVENKIEELNNNKIQDIKETKIEDSTIEDQIMKHLR